MHEYDWLIVTVSNITSPSGARILIDTAAFRAHDISHWTDEDLEDWIRESDGNRAGIIEGLTEIDMIGEFHHRSTGDIF